MSETRTENLNARSAILASIRSSLSASRPFDAAHRAHHHPAVAPGVRGSRDASRETLLENFRAGLEFVGADCRVVSGTEEAAREVRSILDQISARRIAVSDSELVARTLSASDRPNILVNAAPGELFDCDVGITSAQFGIAETGTLVLESDRESHRLTSLVPPVHVCLLRAVDIRRTLGEILEVLNKDLSRTVTFITGASRTSDIELTLAIGVHGPRELHVIVIDER